MHQDNSERVSLLLPKELIKEVDNEIKKLKAAQPDEKINRSSFIRSIIQDKYQRKPTDIKSQKLNYEKTLKSLALARHSAEQKLKSGKKSEAKKLFLQVASQEILALSELTLMNTPTDENIMKSAIIEVLMLIKKATDYKTLPETPKPATSVAVDSLG